MNTPAKIYRRQNGGCGSSCDGIEDTGHYIVEVDGRFTVWSVHDEHSRLCANATRKEAEEAIAADWQRRA